MKKMILLIMVGINLFAWFSVVTYGIQKEDLYKTYKEDAMRFEQNEIYIEAIELYLKAIELFPNNFEDELYLANLYKKNNMIRTFEDYCLDLIEKYDYKEEIVLALGAHYLEKGEILETLELYKFAMGANDDSSHIKKSYEELKFAFELKYNRYSYISSFHNGYAVVKKDDRVGIVDENAEIVIEIDYQDVRDYAQTDELYLFSVRKDNENFMIDKSGNKRLSVEENFNYIGSFEGENPAMYEKNGIYGFVDKSMNILKTNYDDATNFKDGIAMVKLDNKWRMIDHHFEFIGKNAYDEVKVNEFRHAMSIGLIFVKKGGKYLLIDKYGNELTTPTFQDVDMFISENGYAAVQISDKWGFIDKAGNITIEPIYDKAFSFSCGLAPIYLENRGWGYIDIDGNIVIEPQFNMAKSFSSNGVASVLTNHWQFIELLNY